MSSSTLNKQLLEWTRPMLEELCLEVRKKLEFWAQADGADQSQSLSEAIEACERTHGSLSVLNFESATLMAQAMRDALLELHQSAEPAPELVQLVLVATAILPDYLDYVESTEADHIGLILPIVNDLRAAAGKPALEQSDFFPVTLAGVRPPADAVDSSVGFSALRRDLQSALRDFLTQHSEIRLEELKQTVLRVRNHPLLPTGVRRMAWALAGLAELIQAERYAFDVDTSRHFSRLDSLLREVSGEADDFAVSDRADSAVRAVLYQVAVAEADTPLARELAEAFDFKTALDQPEVDGSLFLAGHNSELFHAVTMAAREDLSRIKEALESFPASASQQTDLIPQTELLRSVGASLGMIGLSGLGTRLSEQADYLSELDGQLHEEALLKVAGELILVDSGLADGFTAAMGEAMVRANSEHAPGTLLPRSEFRRILKQLTRECNEDLAHVKHLLDTVARGHADADAPSEAATILTRVSGALRLAGADSAAELIEGAGVVITQDPLDRIADQASHSMKTLAEALTAIEYHLETLTLEPAQALPDAVHQARVRLLEGGYLAGAEALAADAAQIEADTNLAEADEAALITGELETERSEPIEYVGADPALESDAEAVEQAGEELAETLEDRLPDEEDVTAAEAVDETDAIASETTTSDDNFDITEVFLDELDQEFESLYLSIPVWSSRPGDQDMLGNIRRSFHSLKGSGRMIGATEIADFSAAFEALLNQLIEGNLHADNKVVGLIGDGVAALPSLRSRFRGAGEETLDSAACRKLAMRAAELAGKPALMDPDPESEPEESTRPEWLAADEAQELQTSETEMFEAIEPERLEEPAEEEPPGAAESMPVESPEAGQLESTESGQAVDLGEGHQAEPASTDPEPVEERLPAEMADLDETLIGLMSRELSDHLETVAGWVDQAHQRAMPGLIADDLVRAVHTIKGTMRLAPIGDECETAQNLESYLSELALCQSAPSKEGQAAIEECLDLFRDRLSRLELLDIPDERFHGSVLAQRLADLHEQAHRKRTKEDGSPGVQDEEMTAAAGEREQPFGSRVEPELTESDPDALSTVPSLDEADADAAAEPDLGSLETDDAVTGPEIETELGPADAQEPDPEADLESQTEVDSEPQPSSDPEPESALDPEPEVDPEVEAEPEFGAEIEAGLTPKQPSESEPEPVAQAEQEFATQPEAEPVEAPRPGFIAYEELDQELLDSFVEEATELLESSDSLLQRWHETPGDKRIVTALQRNLHTIKGSARMVGLNPIGQVAHSVEELLERIAVGGGQASSEELNVIEAGCDYLHEMVDAVLQRIDLPTRTLDHELTEQVAALDQDRASAVSALDSGPQGDAVDSGTRGDSLRINAGLIDELVNQAGEASIVRSRLDQRLVQLRNNIAEVDETVLRLRNQLRHLEQETEAQILARYQREHGSTEADFDPLELDRYSTIQQLSRALAESVNDLTSLSAMLDEGTRQSEALLLQQSRAHTELQEGLMQARLVSFKTLLPRFRRVVRNTARELGLQVEFDLMVEGEGELDRNVLERIAAPIEHLLRNSISHGIEAPEDRQAKNKAASGSVWIDVQREATELVIKIADDGRGLALDAIRQRAIARGLITANDSPSDDELTQLIFASGFSTAEQVSELAGRGIGMDVVMDTIRQIGGSIMIDNQPDLGVSFTLRIPLSLTVLQVIYVRVSDRQFAIPLQVIRGIVRLPTEDWRAQLSSDEPSQIYAGQTYPLLELEPQLEFDPEEPEGSTVNLLMMEIGGQRACFKVASLLGHREAVIKPVGPQITSIVGILGATISTDGQVVPILDMGPLIRRAFTHGLVPGMQKPAALESQPTVRRKPLIMVVDDSITVRRVTSRVLEQHGYEVLTARDGIEAVETLVDRVPDLILLDIEMPRMDGYQMAIHVRNDQRLMMIPMIMITSRSGEKHRQRAAELGVNDYMSKPYHENDLIARVKAQLELSSGSDQHE